MGVKEIDDLTITVIVVDEMSLAYQRLLRAIGVPSPSGSAASQSTSHVQMALLYSTHYDIDGRKPAALRHGDMDQYDCVRPSGCHVAPTHHEASRMMFALMSAHIT